MPDTNLLSVPATSRIASSPRMARLLLRGDPAALGALVSIALPTTPCTAATNIGRSALWLGPDEWLVLAPEGAAWPDYDGEHGAAVDIGHRQLGYTLHDPAAAQVLSVGCPLDLAPPAFPIGACTRTVYGKAEIVLWRQAADTFHLEVWRSFAPYVRMLLAQAEQDVCGIRPG